MIIILYIITPNFLSCKVKKEYSIDSEIIVLAGMSEEDLCDLLKFDRKMLRQRISTLRADRFIQARMKMVTLEDNKTQKEQYYFINYKVSNWWGCVYRA